jgi:hypothetical protein
MIIPVVMTRNQKIDLHPKVPASTPPMRGPKAGPKIAPAWNNPKYRPFSLGVAISEIVPAPIAITAEPPVAYSGINFEAYERSLGALLTCNIRKTSRSQYAPEGHRAKPILLPKKIVRVPI